MFRGKYQAKTSNGSPIYYAKGDLVVYQGKVYECLSNTEQSPLQKPDSWKYSYTTEPHQSDNPPLNPKENQIWVSGNGRTFIYYKDVDGFQWIET